MRAYNTEQKKIIIKFLRENKENAYTADELSDALTSLYGKDSPGKSTVYRLLPVLAKEGSAARLPKRVGKGFVYQFLERERCHGHLHMRCADCGRLFHLDDGLSDELVMKIRKLSGFSIDERDTVLLGKCMSCR